MKIATITLFRETKPLFFAHFCWAILIFSPIRAQDIKLQVLTADTFGLVNADALKRDQAFLQMELFRNTLNTLEKTDMRYAIARKRLKSSRQLHWYYSRLAESTETTIRTFQAQSPKLYAHIQSLRTDFGKPVVALVGTFEPFSNIENLGETWVSYDTALIQGEPIPSLEEEWVDGIRIMPKINYAVQIYLAANSDVSALRHELGHYEVIVSHSKSYYNYLQHLEHLGKSCNGGHNSDDASGLLARQYERLQR